MGSLREDEDFRFFDAHGDAMPMPVVNSESIRTTDAKSNLNNFVAGSLPYDVWIGSPGSLKERRSKFLNWMGAGLNGIVQENLVDVCSLEGDVDRISEGSKAVLRSSGFEDEFCSCRSSMSCWSNDNPELSREVSLLANFVCREGNLDGGRAGDVDKLGEDGNLNECAGVGSEQSLTGVESDDASMSSPSFQRVMEKEVEEQSKLVGIAKRVKKGWLDRLRSISCLVHGPGEADKLRPDNVDAVLGLGIQRVKVRQYRKQSKELSALYKAQDISAHEGSILTMKFSPDGQYLASAGEDGIVRLWQVVEDDRSDEHDIPEIDPSCLYFTLNHLSELKPLFVDKENAGKLTNLRKTSDSACVILPPKIFRILEKPLHELHGHSSEILDLSWSKNNYLLSASADKTVRLWRVGCDHCLRVYTHSNYVTCVQFNPVNDNYFISGSIDGKVRIWEIAGCQVVDWTDIRDIVTAVCYRPDGQGGIVGSLTGNCRFYSMSDNHLQLDAQICLHNKKKSSCRRITRFQFFPRDPSKVMVTSADSQVRILHGLNVIGKYKGLRNAGSHLSAVFTPDGEHIISACDDASVYMWSCIGQGEAALPQMKNIRSCERFSTDASVAIPWCGFQGGNLENRSPFGILGENSNETMPFSSLAGFPPGQEFFLESFPKGSATWPEEKLPASSPLSPSSMHKSQYKFLKASCQSTSRSHVWGLVIVTAGWDGRIRSFHNYGLPVPV